jgi:hypothetical protein
MSLLLLFNRHRWGGGVIAGGIGAGPQTLGSPRVKRAKAKKRKPKIRLIETAAAEVVQAEELAVKQANIQARQELEAKAIKDAAERLRQKYQYAEILNRMAERLAALQRDAEQARAAIDADRLAAIRAMIAQKIEEDDLEDLLILLALT